VDCSEPHIIKVTRMVDYPSHMAHPELVGSLPRHPSMIAARGSLPTWGLLRRVASLPPRVPIWRPLSRLSGP